MNDASKKSEDIIYKDYGELYIYAEVRLSQCGFFCDILVVSW